MRIVFLETDTLGADVDLSAFSEFGKVVMYPISDPRENAVRASQADILVVNKIPMTAATLSDAKWLKLICLTATGTNNVDFAYTREHGIAVANVKGYSTQSVVQHTFAMLFYLYEKLPYYDQFVKSGAYVQSEIFSHFTQPFHELAGKTFGIIGLGEIGRGVAAVARAFGCEVLYYSTSGQNQNPDYTSVDLQTLLSRSDIVSIHAPLNDATRNLIGARELWLMKPTSYLLNLGRGGIVNEAALAEALLAGDIAGAGLDVLEQEPMRADNPLLAVRDSTRLLITPHIAWATREARMRCVAEVYQNIRAFLAGEPRNLVEG